MALVAALLLVLQPVIGALAHGKAPDGQQLDAFGNPLEKAKGAYAKSHDYYGTPMKEGVKEVAWKGATLATTNMTSSCCASI